MMRVLQVGKYYHPYRGGIETHLQQLCEGLKSSTELEVVVCNTEPRTVRESFNAVSVTRCAEFAHAASTSICPTMGWELSRRDYDVIHIHFPHPMGVAAYLMSSKPKHHRVVVSYHSDIVKQVWLLQLYRPLMHALLRRADAIVTSTDAYAETSEELQPYRSKCRSIPYGVDSSMQVETAEIRQRTSEIRARFKGPLILAVGRLVYYKGFEYLIRAMVGVDATLLIVGAGPLRAELEECARECRVRDRVVFLDALGDTHLAPWYRAADVFVLPSIARSEAFAIVQLEAMAAGLPVVNTSLDSGVPYVSLNGVTGLTVPPKDPSRLADALRQLLADPSLRQRYGRAGQARVATEFSGEVMVRRTLELYRELVGAHS